MTLKGRGLRLLLTTEVLAVVVFAAALGWLLLRTRCAVFPSLRTLSQRDDGALIEVPVGSLVRLQLTHIQPAVGSDWQVRVGDRRVLARLPVGFGAEGLWRAERPGKTDIDARATIFQAVLCPAPPLACPPSSYPRDVHVIVVVTPRRCGAPKAPSAFSS